jgi:hypothetical protein
VLPVRGVDARPLDAPLLPRQQPPRLHARERAVYLPVGAEVHPRPRKCRQVTKLEVRCAELK